MDVLIDTSGLLAVVDPTDAHHEPAADAWRDLLDGPFRLVSTNYLMVELHAVLQRRFGMGLVKAVAQRYEPLVQVHWVDEAVHQAAAAAFLAAGRLGLSLVDCTTFEVMRRLALTRAFTLDPHFAEQGFEVIPELPVGAP